MDVGLTVVDPLAAVDVKVPGVMATDVAPLVLQESVEDWPEDMDAGEALNEAIAGGEDGGVTVTVAVAVVEPTLLVAVRV